MVFPLYVELERRSTERMNSASLWGHIISMIALLAVSIIGLLMFGDKIESDLLMNLASVEGRLSLFIRLTYSLVLVFHIPYFFFTMKEFVLVLYDEIKSRSLSSHLEQKLANF